MVVVGMLRYVYDVCVCTFSVLSAYAYLLSLLAPLPSQIAQSYRYQYDDGYAHANADPYDFLVETTGRVPYEKYVNHNISIIIIRVNLL